MKKKVVRASRVLFLLSHPPQQPGKLLTPLPRQSLRVTVTACQTKKIFLPMHMKS